MIRILRDQHVRQQSWPGYTAFDRSTRSRRLHDVVTLRAAQLRSHMANHDEARGHVLQHLADVFAQLAQPTADNPGKPILSVRASAFDEADVPVMADALVSQEY